MLFLYKLLFPLAFVAFIPAMLYKLIRRPGYKKTYLERFAIFSKEQKEKLIAARGAVWIHAVSVGETMIALSMIKQWKSEQPELKIALSTTTTTGQQLARDKIGDDATVFYCPLDITFFIKKVLRLLQPNMLVIFETEIWPAMICETRKTGAKLVLVNARMSDKSFRGYSRFKSFFQPILQNFNDICVQSEMDGERFSGIAGNVPVHVSGNLKFDQSIPQSLPEIGLKNYFGEGDFCYILAASTHPGEEKLVSEVFLQLKSKFPDIRLVLIPRHAERGNEIVSELNALKLNFYRKTSGDKPACPVDCLLADTTGEMLSFIDKSDIVIMGKSLAGHDEGHNLIEPSLMAKPIITGAVLRNFRFVLAVLKDAAALITVESDSELAGALEKLISDPELREELGTKAKSAIEQHKGATQRVIEVLQKNLESK